MINGTTWVALIPDIALVPEQGLKYWLGLQSQSDQIRAGQFKSSSRRRQFIVARQVLRELIVLKAGEKGVVSVSAFGAPQIEGVELPVWCSISHSGNSVLVGCSTAGPTGVDIERLRARNFLELAKEYFHVQEYNVLLSLPENRRQRYFYNAWCCKEAKAKASGYGLTAQGLGQKNASASLLLWELENYSAAVSHPLNSVPELLICDLELSDFSLRYSTVSGGVVA